MKQVVIAYPEQRFEGLRPNYSLTDYNSNMIIEMILAQLDDHGDITVVLNAELEKEYPIKQFLQESYPNVVVVEYTGSKDEMLSDYFNSLDSEEPILVVFTDIVSEVKHLQPGDYSEESKVYFHKNKNTMPSNRVKNKILYDFTNLESWKAHNNKKVIFCDIDGTIIKAQPKNMYNNHAEILENNVGIIMKEYENGSQIVFTTCRKEEFRQITTEMLTSLGFKNPLLLMGLMKGTRVLINDYDSANPYPRAIALNTLRDSDDLRNGSLF